MKKKIFTTFFFALLLLSLTGCTLHFKSKELEIETKPPEAKLGQNQNNNSTYDLAAIDLLKQKK